MGGSASFGFESVVFWGGSDNSLGGSASFGFGPRRFWGGSDSSLGGTMQNRAHDEPGETMQHRAKPCKTVRRGKQRETVRTVQNRAKPCKTVQNRAQNRAKPCRTVRRTVRRTVQNSSVVTLRTLGGGWWIGQLLDRSVSFGYGSGFSGMDRPALALDRSPSRVDQTNP